MSGSEKHKNDRSAIMKPIKDDGFCHVSLELLRNEDARLDTNNFQSLPVGDKEKSFLLVDQDGNMKINSVENFIENLECPNDCKLMVISIIGNSGDGKSYTLNHLLFKGKEIFKTSKYAEEGTRGIWATYEPAKRILCFDTPPLHHPKSTILLLKIFAISDLIIYKTRAERIPPELYKFLGEASNAYIKNFVPVLEKIENRYNSADVHRRRPTIIINHEPLHSSPLSKNSAGQTPEVQIIEKFKSMKLNTDGLGILYYTEMSVHSLINSETCQLFNAVKKFFENTTVSSYRSPELVFNSLKALCERFESRLNCDVLCEACQTSCTLSAGHESDSTIHFSEETCRFQRQFNNKDLICQKCHLKVEFVEPEKESWLSMTKSIWDYYELKCPTCGIIYKSKEYWYGNKSPEETAVYPKYTHVWPGIPNNSCGRVNVGVRKALESVGSIIGTAYNMSADYIAPSYWQPNSEITNCNVCNNKLNNEWGEIHHCRACGKGVCNQCSTHRAPVPKYGWNDPVRICDRCKENNVTDDNSKEAVNVTSRKVTEAVANTLSSLSLVLNYPKGVLTEFVRPSYWTPDEEAPKCTICDILFGNSTETARHHCRQCGKSICSSCSPDRRPVPNRDWEFPVRVCKKCYPET